MSNMSTLITLGIVGIGGYFFIKEFWPSLKIELENLGKKSGGGRRRGGGGRGSSSPPPSYNDYGPSMMPPYQPQPYPPTTYVVEDRYPDYVIEDRYPDYYISPPPIYYPPTYCPPGKYWNGDRCKNIDIDCPPGFREDDGRCKPRDRNCDRDEFWNGNRCERRDRPDHDRPDRPRPRPRPDHDGRPDRPHPRPRPDHDGPPRPNPPNGNTRDRWHADRDREDRVKAGVVTAGTRPSTTPRVETAPVRAREKDRVKEIVKKASEAFFEVDY